MYGSLPYLDRSGLVLKGLLLRLGRRRVGFVVSAEVAEVRA